jgi:hypothetical protein
VWLAPGSLFPLDLAGVRGRGSAGKGAGTRRVREAKAAGSYSLLLGYQA